MTNTATKPRFDLTGYTHVQFLEGWPLSMVTAPRDSTPEQIIEIAIAKIMRTRDAQAHPGAFNLTVADFRIVGHREAYVPAELTRSIVEYIPAR